MVKDVAVSIIDVAKAAGVSHMTVSRVLNRSRGVRPENVAAVMKAVRELGYKAPLRKRGPKPKRRGRRQREILLVVPEAFDGAGGTFAGSLHGQQVLNGITQAADALNARVALAEHRFDDGAIDVGEAEGLILVTPMNAPADPPEWVDPALPLVVLPQNSPTLPQCDCVAANEGMVGEAAVGHLLAQGCTRLALASADPQQAGGDVYRGFRRAVDRFGVPYDYVGPITYRTEGPDGPEVINATPEVLVDQLASLRRWPDGLVAGVLAMDDLHAALRRRGIQPVRMDPRSGKSVVIVTPGVELLLTNPIRPMPHLLSYDRVAAGRALVRQLLRRMEFPDDPITHLMLGPTILDRPASARGG